VLYIDRTIIFPIDHLQHCRRFFFFNFSHHCCKSQYIKIFEQVNTTIDLHRRDQVTSVHTLHYHNIPTAAALLRGTYNII